MSLLSRYINSSFLVDDDFYSTARSLLRPFTSYYYPSSSRSRVVKLSDDRVKIEVELAGYKKEQIEVYEEDGYLVVTAKDESDSSSRKYSDSWILTEGSKVDKVKFENGLLTVEVSKVVPSKPPRTKYQIE